ncbi:MAG: glycosyltransferase family 2 protein [Deltaproteobacteria bacterium]|nr:glycosyltransferase family 2 protein [Deltaproteobacteria bacterium]
MPLPGTPRVSIVILNWNGIRFLDECLTSVKDQSFNDFELILVDNGSHDGSVDYVNRKYPWVRIISNSANQGFARGTNQGISEAVGTYLVTLNNDTRVEQDWLLELVKAMDADKEIGACQSLVLFYDDPELIYNAGIDISSTGYPRNRGFGEKQASAGRPGPVSAACAWSAIYRREALRQVGLFDESFWSYHEDVDLSWRLRRASWKIILIPTSVVYHHGSGSTSYLSPLALHHSAKNLLLMNVKNGSVPQVVWQFLTIAFRYRRYILKPPCARETMKLLPQALAARRSIKNWASTTHFPGTASGLSDPGITVTTKVESS